MFLNQPPAPSVLFTSIPRPLTLQLTWSANHRDLRSSPHFWRQLCPTIALTFRGPTCSCRKRQNKGTQHSTTHSTQKPSQCPTAALTALLRRPPLWQLAARRGHCALLHATPRPRQLDTTARHSTGANSLALHGMPPCVKHCTAYCRI